jgi:hypothetical protein
VQTTVETFWATIYVGLRSDWDIHEEEAAARVCQEYVDQVGLCVTLTPTRFVYTDGSEDGVAVGLINYPRFPSTPAAIKAHALELARRLKEALGQRRVSVVFPDETVMLGDSNS